MKKPLVDDEFLSQHMSGLEEKLMQAYPGEEDIQYEFSEEFEQKMRKIQKRSVQKERYGFPVSTGRRIAAVIVIVLIGAMALTMNVEAVREKMIKFIRIVHPSYTETRYTVPEGEEGEFVPMYPEYIPKGYEPAIEDEDESHMFLSYEKWNEDELEAGIIIDQQQIIDTLSYSEDTEYVKEKEVTVKGCKGMIGYKEGREVHVRWKNDNCIYAVVADELSEREILRVCNSLK